MSAGVPECDWCQAKAIGEVHAQWTPFDFDTALACERHVAFAYRRFERRTVDGMSPLRIWHLWFEQLPLPGWPA